MNTRLFHTLIMAVFLSGILLDRVLVNAFGAAHINWIGLFIGCALNGCVAFVAYKRVTHTSTIEKVNQ